MSTRDSCFVICPFCGYKHGDAWELCDEDATRMDCQGCEKEFICYAEHSVDYIAQVPLTDREKAILGAR